MTLLSVPTSGAPVLSRAVPATPHVTASLRKSLSCNPLHPIASNTHELAAGGSYSEEPSPRVPAKWRPTLANSRLPAMRRKDGSSSRHGSRHS